MPLKDPEARREYHKKYMKQYLKDPDNKRKHVVRVGRTKEARQARIRAVIAERKTPGCSRCPEATPCCLDFHHLDPAEKRFPLAEAATRCVSLATLKKELDKCILLCKNCHAKEHDGCGAET